ncbi:hypothetical protein HMPREF1049_1855 [Fusobacterium necrophorum subsp. funduliforme ATCC 51357]|uniref:hypothetical protein n=1 Tax=Fusobacterium necrophorum TaxID=859 RepID=UPI00025E65AE|nr:hypothetical protein [Fusobacterium necrophorum]EIJ69900.1 hypothetical protein HMPREF1049_1855 [Fusobacterium necrophorum subsp. funduliforme ATCC 51357]KAB0553191.1 hypothetical protein F7P76_05025 [Fusobacterium necrophorum subsp. funduliforme]
MLENSYTHKEVEREKAQLLLKNFMFEMVWQKDYGWEEEGRKMSTEEVRSMIEDSLARLNDDQFDVLTEKIVSVVFDTF